MERKDIESFLEKQESIGNSLINIRQWAMDQADKKFKKEYEDTEVWTKLYEPSDYNDPLHPHTPTSWTLKEKYNTIYWAVVDNFENELLEYKNDEYE